MQPEIDIAFGFDAPYLPHLGALIHSIIEHAPGARFRFIILHDGIEEARKQLMESVAPNARFYWARVGDSDVPAYSGNTHFSRANFYRLGLEKLAPPDCQRVLYLDTDLIVLGDIREPWATKLNGAPLAAVLDGYMLDGAEFAQSWSLSPSSVGYFNSGVLLIDLAQVRARKLFSAAIDVALAHGERLRFVDQDALNVVAWGLWQPMPPSWNAQRDMVIPTIAEHLPEEMRFDARLPKLVHFTGPEKPWVTTGYHPWSWLYWRHLNKTPFAREVSSAHGVSHAERFRLWFRWLRRKPRS